MEHRSAVPSGVPLCASAPPVKGCLKFTAKTRKRFFHFHPSFFQKHRKQPVFNALKVKTPAGAAVPLC
ncbi:hypothetical protein, partial [Antarcticimicrobium luteum]|uniref:hypothetical protein n=1 Tax=Antarcticimicrobium luteum TaxID=2547397 RepID=UPI00198073A2